MKIPKFLFPLFFTFFILLENSQATHIMGLDLTYKCLGNNQYEVNLSFYRDCHGSNAPSSPTANWTSDCGSGSLTLQQISVVDITPTCMGINNSICNGGNGLYGIEEYTFQGILSLPSTCTNIKLSFLNCCRNYAITTLSGTSGNKIYIETEISDNSLSNSSPVFTNKPVPFVCVNQPVLYNHGASDSDGDQLVYSLSDCYSKEGHIVNYLPGFSATNPLLTTNGVLINASTGALSFTPSSTQVAIICVLVEEYRNGLKIGSVVRDIQFNVVICSNNVPLLSGIDNTSNYNTTVTANTSLCFDVFSNDSDTGQTTSLQWNAGISAATFTTFGSPFSNATFCWTPGNTDVGSHTFTVTVSDDFCPITGQNTYTYTIDVLPDSVPCDSIDLQIVSTQDIACTNNDGAAVLLASNGVAPYNYQVVNWTTGTFFNNFSGNFNNLSPGTYSIWVEDSNGCTPACTGQSFVIGGNANPLQATVNTTDVLCHSTSVNVNNPSNNDGTLTATATNGTIPYMYSIDGVNFQPSGFFGSLAAGNYSVVVLDNNGCSVIVNELIEEPAAINIQVLSLVGASCGQQNGSVELSGSGGTGGLTYFINTSGQGGNGSFSNLAAGSYNFTVKDSNNCKKDTLIVIPESSPGFVLNIIHNNPFCSGSCDGTAAVLPDSAVQGISYIWSTAATEQSLSGLCAGNYSVTASDLNGCTLSASVSLTGPAPLEVTVVSTTDESCSGNDGTATLQVTGGTQPYQIDLANFDNSSTFFSNNGIFTNLNQGRHFVKITDVNGCTEDCPKHFFIDGCSSSLNNQLVAKKQFKPELYVNPNPANSIVQISFKTSDISAGLTIIDNNGRIVINKENLPQEGSLEIFLDRLKDSSYFVVLRNNKGKVLKTRKLIIVK
jgi:hypothetical protein